MKNVITGLTILLRYDPQGDICAEHDVIYAGHDVDPSRMTADDLADMEKAHWKYDTDIPSWRKFV